MASYLPAQRNIQSWESTPPKPGQRAPLMFPAIHSGSGRSFEGHSSGAPEFQTPVLSRTTDFVKRNVGNFLLYKAVYERGTEKIVAAEHETREAILHPDGGGALSKLAMPGAQTDAFGHVQQSLFDHSDATPHEERTPKGRDRRGPRSPKVPQQESLF